MNTTLTVFVQASGLFFVTWNKPVTAIYIQYLCNILLRPVFGIFKNENVNKIQLRRSLIPLKMMIYATVHGNFFYTLDLVRLPI